MTFEKTYEARVKELTIKLPKEFQSKERVRVIIEEIDESRQEKIEILKNASKDPLFLSDIEEIAAMLWE